MNKSFGGDKVISILMVGFSFVLAGCVAVIPIDADESASDRTIRETVSRVKECLKGGDVLRAKAWLNIGKRDMGPHYDWSEIESLINSGFEEYCAKRQKKRELIHQRISSGADFEHCVGYGLIKEEREGSRSCTIRRKGDENRIAMAKTLSEKCSAQRAADICKTWERGPWYLSKTTGRHYTDNWERFFDGDSKYVKYTWSEDVANFKCYYACKYEPVFFFCEAFAVLPGQNKFYDFLGNIYREQRFAELVRQSKFAERISPLMLGENEPLLFSFVTNNYTLGFSLAERAYALLSPSNRLEFAKLIASQNPFRDGYDYSFEKRVLKQWRKELVAVYGCESSAYPPETLVKEFSNLLYSPTELADYRMKVVEARGRFDGLFGRKFGELVDVSTAEYVYVNDWKTAFWRVKFEPEKKSSAFQDYYLWMTLASHKVFAVEARSKKWAPEGFLELLEKRYQLKFTKNQDIAEMVFPVEKCSLKVFGATSGADRAGLAMVTALFAGAIFGDRGANDVLGEYAEDVEKRKRQSGSYKFGKGGDDFNSLIVAEDVALGALAKKEAEELWERRRKEQEQKKKKEAEDAASAF